MPPLVEPSSCLVRLAGRWGRARRDWLAPRVSPRDAIRLTRSYATQLAHRLPLLYTVVIFNILVLATSFWHLAPRALTVLVPAGLICGLVSRAAYWMPTAVARRPTSLLARDLRRLDWIGPIAALACTLWVLALYPYGDPARHNLVHYMTAVTCFSGILGLGQAPGTALRMAVVTMVPATLSLLYHLPPSWTAVCAVQIVVTLILLLVTRGYHADFVALELSRQALDDQERKSARLALDMQQQAGIDALTGVSSRRAILARLETMLCDAERPSPWLALVDLDGFKNVNDSFGHAAGDLVLRTVCRRIVAFDEVEACGRLGGDEFALLLDGSRERGEVHDILTRLAGAVAEPVPYEAFSLSVAASIGLRLTERGSVSECLERADEALYKAKRETRGSVVEFSSSDERALRERAAVTQLFSAADLKSRIGVAYQPIVDYDASRTVAFEALARWSTAYGEAMSPDTFIPLAESTGRISELTEIVLARALCDFPAWRHGARLSINLSAQDILKEDAAAWLAAIVAASEAPAAAITFEITETALLADIRRAAANLEALRKLGFEIALDDFGTGQSSLSHVHRLPIDQVKLDRSFASELETSRTGRAVAATVLAMTRQLQVSCSIEGIETASQAIAARTLGFRLMQGYHFGRPLEAEAALGSLLRAA